MNSLFERKRSIAIFGVGILAISIGVISKKVINYPPEGCMKGIQELTFKKKINNYFIY